MEINYYTDLKVWQRSMDLAVTIYQKVRILPKEELFGLSDQMRRAVVSIPSNIAEGQQRNSLKEYIHFLYLAKGSLAELETQLLLCERLGYISIDQTEPMKKECAEIGKMLNVLIKRLQDKLTDTRNLKPGN